MRDSSKRRGGIVALGLAGVLLAGACSSSPTATTASGPAGATTTAVPTPAGGTTPGTVGGAPATSSPVSTPAASAAPAKASAGCTAKLPDTITPGKVLDTSLAIGERTNGYRLYIPASLTTGTPVPLLFDLHGLTQPRESQAAVSGWEALSEKEHFVVVTPQGGGAVPNWSATLADDNPDTKFLETLMDKAQAELCIDLTRVYVGGISNGGLESSIIGCKLADRVAAVGVVAGIVVPEACATARPMPVIAFWGKLDCVLPFYGGLGPCLGPRQPGVARTAPSAPPADSGGVPPVEDSIAAWAKRNGCDEKPTVTSAGEHTEKRAYTSCTDGAAVELYVVSNGGHTWPGSKLAAAREKDPNAPDGITTLEIDATALMWAFYQRFQVPA